MKKSVAISTVMAVVSLLVLLFGAQAVHAAEGTTNANAEARSGIGPDSFLYFLEIAIDRINLALTFDHSAKAEKGLKIAEKRLIEVKEMVEENKLDAAKKAQREHGLFLASVEKSIKAMAKSDSKEELSEEIKLEKELEEHEKEVDAVIGNLELRIKVKGEIMPEQQALIDSILAALQNKTGEVKVSIENKKGKTKTKIEIETGKSMKEIEDDVKELEEKSGLLGLKKERAEERINFASEELADAKAKLQSSSANATANATAAVQLVSEAEIKLQRARQAFNELDFGEAFGQATAAARLARNAERVLNLSAEVEEEIGEAEAKVLEIKARIVGNQAEVSVRLGFVSNSTNSSVIAQHIKERLSLSKENISSLLTVEDGTSLMGERLAAEAKIIDGFAVVKSKYRFDLNTTNTTDIVNGIYDKLSALTTANISSALEVKAGKAEDENEQEENERKIEVEVKRGIAHIKIGLNGSEFKYSIPFTNETGLFSSISAKTGLSLAEVSSITELEVKESSESSDRAEVDEESEEEESD